MPVGEKERRQSDANFLLCNESLNVSESEPKREMFAHLRDFELTVIGQTREIGMVLKGTGYAHFLQYVLQRGISGYRKFWHPKIYIPEK